MEMMVRRRKNSNDQKQQKQEKTYLHMLEGNQLCKQIRVWYER